MKAFIIPLVCVLSICYASHSLAGWSVVKLNDLAVRGADGKIIVSGTEGSYNNDPRLTKEAAFDGDTGTYFDQYSSVSSTTRCWAGIQLPAPRYVTRIRYFGRPGQADRMKGVYFQGANRADFSDAVTLHVGNPPENWECTTWVDVTLSDPACSRPYTYLRIYGPNLYRAGENENGICAGNAAEVEFYGSDSFGEGAAPASPEFPFANALNGVMNLKMTLPAPPVGYVFQRKSAFDPDFQTVHAFCSFQNPGSLFWRDLERQITSDTVYRFAAYNSFGTSEWTTVSIPAYEIGKGKWIGTQGSWQNAGNVGSKIFDGDVTSVYDAHTGNGVWAGLDLGTPRKIKGIRFVPRETQPERALHAKFQISDTPDFARATDLYEVAETPSPWKVTEVELAAPVEARYVRYLSPDNGFGNMAEVEFDLENLPAEKPSGFEVAMSDLTNQYAKITFARSQTVCFHAYQIDRGTAPGGPWTRVSPAEGISRSDLTWVDTNMLLGVKYYYRIAYQGRAGIGPMSDEFVSHCRYARIERDWNDLSRLKAGMKPIFYHHVYPYNDLGAPENLFDGNLSTYADILPENPSKNGEELIGVDLNGANRIAFFRIYPRATLSRRLVGVCLYGSSNPENWRNDAVQLSAPIQQDLASQWQQVPCSDLGAYRYLFLRTPHWKGDPADGFFGNASELEFYGVPSDAPGVSVLHAPLQISFETSPEGVSLAWENCVNAQSYRVERKNEGAKEWTLLASGLTDPSYRDRSVTFDGTVYLYRVTSVRTLPSGDEEVAHSVSYRKIPYLLGEGTGLSASYRYPYRREFDPSEKICLTRVDPQIDFHWEENEPMIPSIPGSTNDVGIVWNGQLIVPFDGNYTFIGEADDTVALQIDRKFIFNCWHFTGVAQKGTVFLTKGTHDIRVSYYEGVRTQSCALKWGGCVEEEIIPASQLIPVDLPALPSPWMGERTINSQELGSASVDPASGEVEILGFGDDVHGKLEQFHYLWQPVSGAFDCTLHFEAIGTPTPYRKVMLMIRNRLQAGSPLLAVSSLMNGNPSYAWGCKIRDVEGEDIRDFLQSPPWLPDTVSPASGWFRLRRMNRELRFYGKLDGRSEWKEIGVFEDRNGAFARDLLIGPAVSGGRTYRVLEFSLKRLDTGTRLLLQ